MSKEKDRTTDWGGPRNPGGKRIDEGTDRGKTAPREKPRQDSDRSGSSKDRPSKNEKR